MRSDATRFAIQIGFYIIVNLHGNIIRKHALVQPKLNRTETTFRW